MNRIPLSTRFLLCLILLLLSQAGRASAEPFALDLEGVGWRSARFEASKLFFRLRLDVALEFLPAAQARLRPPAEGGGLLAQGERVVLLKLESRLAGRRREVRLWLDGADGRVLQRISLDRKGRRSQYKIHRFGEGVVSILRRRPADRQEAEGAPDSWSEVRRKRQAWPPGEGFPSEPNALLLLLAAAPLERKGDEVVIPFFADARVVNARFRVVEEGRRRARFRLAGGEEGREVEGRREVIVVRVSPLDDAISFLGLEGEIEVVLDRRLRVPLEIRGRAPVVGEVRLRLVTAEPGEP